MDRTHRIGAGHLPEPGQPPRPRATPTVSGPGTRKAEAIWNGRHVMVFPDDSRIVTDRRCSPPCLLSGHRRVRRSGFPTFVHGLVRRFVWLQPLRPTWTFTFPFFDGFSGETPGAGFSFWNNSTRYWTGFSRADSLRNSWNFFPVLRFYWLVAVDLQHHFPYFFSVNYFYLLFFSVLRFARR